MKPLRYLDCKGTVLDCRLGTHRPKCQEISYLAAHDLGFDHHSLRAIRSHLPHMNTE